MNFEFFHLLLFLSGLAAGFFLCIIYQKNLAKKGNLLAKTIFEQNEEKNQNFLRHAFLNLQNALKEESLINIKNSTENLLNVAGGQMNNAKNSITQELSLNRNFVNQQVERMNTELNNVNHLLHSLEKKQNEKIGELNQLLQQTNEQTKNLFESTTSIKQLLSNSQRRGMWGEQVAEDIIQSCGFTLNIHYKKQQTLATGERPDFTFILPKNLLLHMDVKFPIENYRKSLEQNQDSSASKQYEKLFLSDIKTALKDILNRNYIHYDTTVNCVLVFIPHEPIFSFIQEKSPELFEYCMQKNIILCSPMTLMAILAIIRKSIDNFAVQQTTQDILSYLANFKKQWNMYLKAYDTVGKKIADLDQEFQKLTSTRTRQLDNSLAKFENLDIQS